MKAESRETAAGRAGLDRGLQLRIFARSLALQAAWNFEGMQNLGFYFAMAPWLDRVWPEPGDRRRAGLRHLGFFNTTPQMAGLALGVVGALEEELSGAPEAQRPKLEERIVQVKRLLGSALAALGDALFWGTLRPFCAALALAALVAAVETGSRAPWAWLVGSYLAAFNAAALAARWKGIELGHAWGERFPSEIQALPLKPLSRALKIVGLALASFAALAFLLRSGSQAAGIGMFGLFMCLKLARLPNRWIYAGLLAGAAAWRAARGALG